MKKGIKIVLSIVFISHLSFNISAQENANVEMKPISEEAFQVVAQFFQYDKHVPLDAKVIGKDENEFYSREKIVFTGFRGSQVVGYLAIPKTGKEPYPCVLQMHGGVAMGKEAFWPGSPYTDWVVTEGLLKSGFAVLTLDAQFYGERKMINNYKSGSDDLFGDNQVYNFLDLIVKSTIEYRRAIDYLETIPAIDANRIAASGYSLGGMMSFYLTAIEPRVKAAVPCLVGLNFYGVGTNKAFPWTMPSVLSPWNFAKAIGDKPFHLMMSNSDPFYSKQDARNLFELVGGENKTLKFYDCEGNHCLPKEHANDLVAWIKEKL